MVPKPLFIFEFERERLKTTQPPRPVLHSTFLGSVKSVEHPISFICTVGITCLSFQMVLCEYQTFKPAFGFPK